MGAQIYEAHLNDILKYIDWPKKRGRRSLVAANALPEGEFAKGCFMRPTLITNVTNDMRIAQEDLRSCCRCN